MVKQWRNLSEEKIKKLEKEFKNKTIQVKIIFLLIELFIQENKILPYKIFKEEINNLKDLMTKTNFLEYFIYFKIKLFFHLKQNSANIFRKEINTLREKIASF